MFVQEFGEPVRASEVELAPYLGLRPRHGHTGIMTEDVPADLVSTTDELSEELYTYLCFLVNHLYLSKLEEFLRLNPNLFQKTYKGVRIAEKFATRMLTDNDLRLFKVWTACEQTMEVNPSFNLFHLFATNASLPFMEFLLTQSAYKTGVNALDANADCPLNHALVIDDETKRLAMLRLLIDNDGDPLIMSGVQKSPIQLAITSPTPVNDMQILISRLDTEKLMIAFKIVIEFAKNQPKLIFFFLSKLPNEACLGEAALYACEYAEDITTIMAILHYIGRKAKKVVQVKDKETHENLIHKVFSNEKLGLDGSARVVYNLMNMKVSVSDVDINGKSCLALATAEQLEAISTYEQMAKERRAKKSTDR